MNFVPGSNGGWMKLVVVVAKLGEKNAVWVEI